MYFKEVSRPEPALDETQGVDRQPVSDVVIRVSGLSKSYSVHKRPSDRLKEIFVSRWRRGLGLSEKSYSQSFTALEDISFDVRRGETVGIVGRNGSGKSTLLQIICGTLSPTAGSVQINGRVAALLELGSGFNPEFTGRENVYMNGAILGLSEAEIDSKFDSIHAFSEIGDFIERPVKTYSSGMLVRLAFAVIVHVDADILVVDEALSVGDAFFVQKCMRFLRKFMETGTILFVSHDTGAVVNLCNRAIWLESGRMVRLGSPKEVSEAYLEKQYESMQPLVNKQTDTMQTSSTLEGPTTAASAGEFTSGGARDGQMPYSLARDMRADFLAHSNLRNDLEVFSFDESSTGFGAGGASIGRAWLADCDDAPVSWVVGGEAVRLRIECAALSDLQRPIIGFVVRDRLGQTLFGDNTYLSHLDNPVPVAAGKQIAACFEFQMPFLPLGDYTISIAISDGTQHEHVLHQWLIDAISFKSHSTSVTTGLVGVPMRDIVLEAI